MAELTLKAIEDLLDLKLDEKFDVKLAPIQKTLGQHTTMLDGLAKDVKKVLDEKTVTEHRLERLEDWGQKVGKKLEIKLEL
jgi:hypothetical protein